MTTVALADARKVLGAVVDRVRYRGESIVLTANGTPAAALVPVETLALLQQLEDASDVRAARRALKAIKTKGGTKPLAEFLAERGL
ncbi:MAG: type II toxin-antitoxin system Phd/YefM family antitoxin [Acidobacteria bacterium]|nr:type II toxin-antitoxin system Phd/YefM family antitoxin [Acidobacteriota bacterium]